MPSPTTIFLSCFAFTGLMLIITLVPVSIDTVNFDEYGLDYDTYSKEVRSQVYEPGRHVIGVGHRFLKFPRVFQTSNFDGLTCRTSEGLAIYLDISYQWSISKDNVWPLFNLFGLDYKVTAEYMARNKLRDVASAFDSISFFTNRTTIADHMQTTLVDTLKPVFQDVHFLQLRNIRLPGALDTVIEQKEVEKQNAARALNQRQTSVVQAGTDVQVAEIISQTVVINATVEAQKIVQIAQAEANATVTTYVARAQGYYDMQSTLGLNTSQLLALAWLDSVRAHDSATLYVNLDKPAILSLN
eukprot:TRINITY_DN482_c0_g1_i1.p1 TRINITY_DN482_c0_g1~~TRINITY_DN482_c0_g1_i1.p1  ORF type:complete len:300 (+),score=72.04 TRINITY_DN482_c0_g1_i1:71-970(+)